jgi:hypothetical protein
MRPSGVGDKAPGVCQLSRSWTNQTQDTGHLGQVVSEDLFGVGKELARTRLLAVVQEGRRKPPMPPQFPGEAPPVTEPEFPGLVPGELDDDVAAGGPMTTDNPYAVAFAFWHAALNDN